MRTIPVVSGDDRIRLMGRLDATQKPIALDWTGTGAEVLLRGSNLWARLEAPVASPVMWMIVLADGHPVTRFPVQKGCRSYPLLLGMDADKTRLVTLMKETQCMPDSPEATVLLHSFRSDGELLPVPPRSRLIEFVGDSLTSGEGALAPNGNDEWITPWFTAWGNYPFVTAEKLNADFRILSQSGYGVCWDWQHEKSGNMSDGYEKTVGVLSGPAAEARGCTKSWTFDPQPDIVCVRLTTNDQNGMNMKQSFNADKETVITGCQSLLRTIRRRNPSAKIVWILPSSDCHPEVAAEAVTRCLAEGMENLFTVTLPDYGPDDMGARFHPNARWNRAAGLILADKLAAL